MIDLILQFLVASLLALSAAMGTIFLDFCFGHPHEDEMAEGRIFSFYGRWIKKKYEESERKNSAYAVNWYKAFGMCPICFNVWFSMLGAIPLIWFQILAPWCVLPYIFVSNFLFRLMFTRWMSGGYQ